MVFENPRCGRSGEDDQYLPAICLSTVINVVDANGVGTGRWIVCHRQLGCDEVTFFVRRKIVVLSGRKAYKGEEESQGMHFECTVEVDTNEL